MLELRTWKVTADPSIIFELIMCDENEISSHDVANALTDYLLDPDNISFGNVMFGNGNTAGLVYNIAVRGNKVYFGGLSH